MRSGPLDGESRSGLIEWHADLFRVLVERKSDIGLSELRPALPNRIMVTNLSRLWQFSCVAGLR